MLKRLVLSLILGALCLALFFRGQLADGFTLLLGDRHDGVIELAILEHWWNVLRGFSAWDRTFYFHPVPATLGYNDGYLLFGLIHAGFRALGIDPFLASELVNVSTRAIGFAAMLALGRRVLGLGFGWALLGAVLFTLSNALFIRGSHAQLFSVSFVPILALLGHAMLAALWQARRGALLGWGAAFCLWFAACLLTGFYMAWYAVFLTAALVPAWLLVAGAAARRHLWGVLRAQAVPLLLIAAFGIALNLPFLFLYLPKAAETGMHPWPEVLALTPSPLDLINVGERNWVWGWLVAALNDAFRPGFPAWSEQMTGFPPLLLGCFVAALVWLAGGGGTVWLRALAIATAVTWALTLRVGEHSLWALVHGYFPGGKAPRVVARYQIFLAVPVLGLALAFLASRRWPRPAMALVMAALLVEQGNAYAPRFLDRPLELARLRAVPPPPAACRAFYISAARTESRFGEAVANPYNHNVEAMIVAEYLRLPTINGISTFNPPHWPDGIPEDAAYRAAVAEYARLWRVTGLCALDLQRFTWEAPKG